MQGVAGDDERRMTIVQHLEELRRVLIWVMAAWIVGTIVAFVFNGFFIGLLLHPLHTVLHNSHSIIPGNEAIILNPTEGITVPLKVSAVVGLIIALPVMLWQIVELRFAGFASEGAEVRRPVHRQRTAALCGRSGVRILRDAHRAQLPDQLPERQRRLFPGPQQRTSASS